MASTSLIQRGDYLDAQAARRPGGGEERNEPASNLVINMDNESDDGFAQSYEPQGKFNSEILENGDIRVRFGDEPKHRSQLNVYANGVADEHDANLAEFLDDNALGRIAADLQEMIRNDEQSAAPWRERLKRGMELIGVNDTDDDQAPFPGASTVTHPMISEAIVQFNARTMKELMPPDGPVKGQIKGEDTEEKREAAQRVEDHMNYQITEEDPGYFEQMDMLTWYLPFAGSAYKKTYPDIIKGVITSTFIKAENLVLPYTATSLYDAPRFSIRTLVHRGDLKRLQVSGYYRNTPLVNPMNEQGASQDFERVEEIYDEAEGKYRVIGRNDHRHTMYETYIDYDLPGFEHEKGLLMPYTITMDYSSRKVLAIYRNWRKNDPRFLRRDWVTQYKYFPGFGAHGMGLVHVIGGLARATTHSIRALLDSASFATLQGGFKAKDAHLPAGDIEMEPGVYHDVDMSADELSKAFYTPPFKEPSPALFQLVSLMESNGRRFAGTTDSLVGDGKNTGPVGTTVALIEQASQPMSGIHKRLHQAMRRELRIRAELNAEYLPDGGIYFNTPGGQKHIAPNDYNLDNIDVIPVSDPNITSSTQRIGIAQAMLELAEKAPDLYKRYAVHARMLQALGVRDTDEILIDPDDVPRCDPVGEGSRLIAGKQIRAFIDQNHKAHNAVHSAQMEIIKTVPDKDLAQKLMMEMTEHMLKHEAYDVYNTIQGIMGQQLPPIDLYSDNSDQEVPPEVEAKVSILAAQMVPQISQYFASQVPPPPEDQETQAKIKREDLQAMADDKRKQDSFDAEEARKATAFRADQSRTDIKASSESIHRVKESKLKQAFMKPTETEDVKKTT